MTGGMGPLLAGGVLLCSLALLYQRRLEAMIRACAVQAVILAAACAWYAQARRAPDLLATGIMILLAQGVGFPWALRRTARLTRQAALIDLALGVVASLGLGLILAGAALLAVTRLPPAMPRESLGVALCVMLLGMALTVTRRGALMPVVGFLGLADGLILAALAVPGLPLPIGIALGLLAIPACLLGGLFVHQPRAPEVPEE